MRTNESAALINPQSEIRIPQSRSAGVEKFTQLGSGFVELGLGGADGATEDARDLFVLVAFDVVEDEGRSVAGRQFGDGAFERQAVDHLRSLRRGRADGLVRAYVFVFERVLAPRLVLAEAHQDL